MTIDTKLSSSPDDSVKLITAACVRTGMQDQLLAWNERVSNALRTYTGFTSREVIPPQTEDVKEWVFITRFKAIEDLRHWRQSETCARFIEEARPLAQDGLTELVGHAAVQYHVENSVTEVILDQVAPGKEAAYQDWANRIQRDQAASPGYQGGYSQPPKASGEGWMTLMRFANVESLNQWLNSPVRKARLAEVKDLVAASYQHRVDTSFPGWAPSDPNSGQSPSNWKTTMLVLAGLYPIVCLEILFLMKLFGYLGWNAAVAGFIANALSVTLVAYITMPWLCRCLDWWLLPKGNAPISVHVKGTLIVTGFYVLSIALFWRWM